MNRRERKPCFFRRTPQETRNNISFALALYVKQFFFTCFSTDKCVSFLIFIRSTAAMGLP